MQDLTISDITITPLSKSAYVEPLRLSFNQNGRSVKWDIIKTHESVVILIFNVSRQVVVFVRQFRPAVYFCSVPEEARKAGHIDAAAHPAALGVTLELCAGIVDKSKSLVEIAKDEVLEECGYDVPVESFQKFKTVRQGIGTEGCRQTFFYVEVKDDMKVSQGGGLADDGEMIEVVEMTIPEVEALVDMPEVVSPAGLLYGLMWFLNKKAPKH